MAPRSPSAVLPEAPADRHRSEQPRQARRPCRSGRGPRASGSIATPDASGIGRDPQLVALAIQNAGSTDGDAIRQGFYKIDSYDGLIKHYKKPFTPDKHDALGEDDYIWTRFIGHEILPVEMAANK